MLSNILLYETDYPDLYTIHNDLHGRSEKLRCHLCPAGPGFTYSAVTSNYFAFKKMETIVNLHLKFVRNLRDTLFQINYEKRSLRLRHIPLKHITEF